MRLKIQSVDHAPDDLYDQVPVCARLLCTLAGRDRWGRDWWLAELTAPITWTTEDGVRTIRHLLVAARWEGTVIQSGARIPVNIAYVTNDAILSSRALDFSQAEYVAIGMAKITKAWC